jgi:branched-chain amino acid transport system substrate-binding protein
MRTFIIPLVLVSLMTTTSLLAQKKEEIQEGPIRIGAILSLTGSWSAFGRDVYRGFQLAIDEANRNGGISGTRIVIDTVDDRSGNEGAIAAFRQLAKDRPAAIMGPMASSGMIALGEVSDGAGIMVVSPYATRGAVVYSGTNLFRVSLTDTLQGPAMARFARRSLGLKRVAILCANSFDDAALLAIKFRRVFREEGGEIIVEDLYHSTTDYEEDRILRLLGEIAATRAEAIYLPAGPHDVGRIAALARSIGITIPILGSESWNNAGSRLLFDSLESPGLLDGCYMTSLYAVDDPSPATREFARLYRERFETDPPTMAALGYDAALLMIAALRKAGSSRSEAVRNAVIGLTIDGATGEFTIGEDRQTRKRVVIQKIENGAMKFVERVEP